MSLTAGDPEADLRELAREHPEDFRRVAERAGGAIERRLLGILEEEQESGGDSR